MHSDLVELPVEWFDIPDDDPDQAANNDLGPTPADDLDYSPWWDTEREWIEPHPVMDGYTCSTGYRHVRRQRSPVDAVGLANCPVPRSTGLASYA